MKNPMAEIPRRHALKQWQSANRKNAERPFEWWENRRKTLLQTEQKYHHGFTLTFWLTYFAFLAIVFSVIFFFGADVVDYFF